MTIEHRRATRYPIVASVEVCERKSGVRVLARTSDLSTTGCYIDILNPLPPGTDVDLRLSYNGEVVAIEGIVAFSVSRLGMGIQFNLVQEAERKVLQRWIAKVVSTL